MIGLIALVTTLWKTNAGEDGHTPCLGRLHKAFYSDKIYASRGSNSAQESGAWPECVEVKPGTWVQCRLFLLSHSSPSIRPIDRCPNPLTSVCIFSDGGQVHHVECHTNVRPLTDPCSSGWAGARRAYPVETFAISPQREATTLLSVLTLFGKHHA